MRTKQVTIEGQSFTIAPLNVEQVEALVGIDANDSNAGREAAYRTVIDGLNNAQPKSVEEPGQYVPRWDRQRVRQELDWPTFRKLQTEILEFTGLTAEAAKPSGEATGEAPAAPVKLATAVN